MPATVTRQHILVNGEPVAGAVVIDAGTEVTIRIHVVGGHVPPEARRKIVEKAFRSPAFGHARPVRATVPLGDPELIVELSRRLHPMHARAAGSTCLIEGIATTEETP